MHFLRGAREAQVAGRRLETLQQAERQPRTAATAIHSENSCEA
jgi:hypothetical protein